MGRKNRGGQANWADRDRLDFYRCFNEAEDLYLIGCSLETISDRVKVTVKRLENWKERYVWETKKAAMMETPRGIGAMLREHLRVQVQEAMEKKELNPEKLEEIGRLTGLISKIEGGSANILAATLEVLKGFSVWLRKQCENADEYHLVSGWLQNYLRVLTDV
jgi:hypothetical protein